MTDQADKQSHQNTEELAEFTWDPVLVLDNGVPVDQSAEAPKAYAIPKPESER